MAKFCHEVTIPNLSSNIPLNLNGIFNSCVCLTLECTFGKYGVNCMETCSVNCNVSISCNRTTGVCIGGCQPGWIGLHCDQSKTRSVCVNLKLTFFYITRVFFKTNYFLLIIMFTFKYMQKQVSICFLQA